ncbi:putative non-specific serine/threonine protein kinase [Helianthus annuus]|nr:putative non-specific serine/threonine protein kinase [Helianthus annuus]
MAYIPLFFHAIILLLCSTTLAKNQTDHLALLAIKSSITDDPQHVLDSWNTSLHFCQWQGVTCGRRHPRVTKLDLGSRGLVGSLSPQIRNLSFLRVLRLENNIFKGVIPPQVGNLFRVWSWKVLEMMTGKRPTDQMFQEGLNLHGYVKMAMPDHFMAVIEPALLHALEEEMDCWFSSV